MGVWEAASGILKTADCRTRDRETPALQGQWKKGSQGAARFLLKAAQEQMFCLKKKKKAGRGVDNVQFIIQQMR